MAAVEHGLSGPVRLETAPRDEAVSLNSLIQTDNKLFNKVILIFAYLCDQVEILKQQAHAHFYTPLLLLAEGEDLGGEDDAPKARSRLPAPSAKLSTDTLRRSFAPGDTAARGDGRGAAAAALRDAAVRRARQLTRDQLAPPAGIAVRPPRPPRPPKSLGAHPICDVAENGMGVRRRLHDFAAKSRSAGRPG